MVTLVAINGQPSFFRLWKYGCHKRTGIVSQNNIEAKRWKVKMLFWTKESFDLDRLLTLQCKVYIELSMARLC